MFLEIIKILLPVVTSLLIGVYCKKKKIFNDNANESIKGLLNNVILPIVLFNSFSFGDYSAKSAVYIFSSIIGMGVAFLLARILRRFFVKEYREFVPEHVTTWEGGTIGLSLATLLLGTFGTQNMAVFDFGHAIFLFGLVIPIFAIRDGERASVKQVTKIIFSAITFDFAMIGAICGMFGFANFVNSHEAISIIYHGIVDIVTSSATFLILVSVGYSINVDKKLIVPIFTTYLARIVFMGIAFITACFFITRFVPLEKNILLVLLIGYTLPPTFALQIFTNFKGQKHVNEFSSAFTSVATIMSLVFFVLISIYAHM